MNPLARYNPAGEPHNRPVNPQGAGDVSAASVRVRGADLPVFDLGGDSSAQRPLLVWAHGWGHTHQNLMPLARATGHLGRSLLLDFPGFGAAPPPPGAWGTAEYADAVAEWLAGVAAPRRVWIAHSFGTRVGLQLAARHPELVDGLFLIAAAGLPRRRSLPERLHLGVQRWAFGLACRATPEGPARDRLRDRFGSTDYRQAGPLRPILVKAVTEDLTEVARAVRCPALLLYGDQDRETPPELGTRFAGLMPRSRLVVLRGFDHWNVLTEGRHQIAQRLGEFIEQLG
jgi:pimeloyl-ACP methyl ester carboxylesterase